MLGLAILSACGSGGGSGASAPTGSLLPAGGSSLPQSFSESRTVAFPANGAIVAGTTVAATFSSHGGASMPPLSLARRTDGLAVRDAVGFSAIEYFELEFFVPVTLPEAPAFALTAPGTFTTAGTTYWLAFFDPTGAAPGWHDDFEGPAVLKPAPNAVGKPVTEFSFASNGRPITFNANQLYYFALIARQGAAPTPSPRPSESPEPTRPPEPTHSPEPTHPPTARPSESPEPHPSKSPEPVTSPSPKPSHSPSPCPSKSPEPHPSKSPEPTHSPTPKPSRSPEPTHSPEPTPTPTPTASPTQAPR